MTVIPEDFMVQALKQQLEFGLRIYETLVEGATKLREMQLQAATEAHAGIDATRKSIAAASDMQRIVELQAQWIRANAQKSAAYWRGCYDVCVQTQGELARCAQVAPVAPAEAGDSKQALLRLIDNAYKQWLDSTQQFYKLPAIPAEAKPEDRAAA